MKLENTLNYPDFNRAKMSWVFVFSIYITSQILFLLSSFSLLPFSVVTERFVVLIAIFGLVYLALFVPDGLLLPKAQIMKLIKIYQMIGYQEKKGSFLLKKTIEYIEYIAYHATKKDD